MKNLDRDRVRDWLYPELRFSEMPEKPIPGFLGKKELSRRVALRHRGGRSTLVHEHVSLIKVCVYLLALGTIAIAGALTLEDQGWSFLGWSLLAEIFIVFGGAIGALLLWLFRQSNLAYLARGPILEVIAGDMRVMLHQGKQSIDWESMRAVARLRGFTEVDEKKVRAQQISIIVQEGELFRQIPLVTIRGHKVGAALKLADLLYLPLIGGRNTKRLRKKRTAPRPSRAMSRKQV